MAGKRISAVGDMVCDIMCSPVPNLGEADIRMELDGMILSPGGNTLNFALSAASFGSEVSFYGARGEDAFGMMLARWMEKLDVKDHSTAMKGEQTSTTIAIPNLSGERRLLTYPGANSRFHIKHGNVDLDGAGHVHSGGFWFTREMASGGTLELFKQCRKKDIQTSLDPATPPFGFSGYMAQHFKEVLPYVDILFANIQELQEISGTRDITKGAGKMIDKGVGTVVVHRGDRGSSIINTHGRTSFQAYHVLVPKNPTGCGDVFNGVFIGATMEGRPVEEAAEMGMAAASLHLASAEPVYPGREEIMLRMRRGK